MEAYCEGVERLARDLAALGPKSRGLSSFQEYLKKYAESAEFTSLVAGDQEDQGRPVGFQVRRADQGQPALRPQVRRGGAVQRCSGEDLREVQAGGDEGLPRPDPRVLGRQPHRGGGARVRRQDIPRGLPKPRELLREARRAPRQDRRHLRPPSPVLSLEPRRRGQAQGDGAALLLPQGLREQGDLQPRGVRPGSRHQADA